MGSEVQDAESIVEIVLEDTNFAMIIYCNCRGAGSMEFRQRVLDMFRQYNLPVLIMAETKVPSSRAHEFFSVMQFDKIITSKAIGFASEIRVCWKEVR